jgi:hypothetical protein
MTYVKQFRGKEDDIFTEINNHALAYGVRILGTDTVFYKNDFYTIIVTFEKTV